MSNAWETTEDDVLNVIHYMGKKASSEQVQSILNDLNHFAIEDAALNGINIGSQTVYAYKEIEDQINKMGVLI